jgi:hypothetical protein
MTVFRWQLHGLNILFAALILVFALLLIYQIKSSSLQSVYSAVVQKQSTKLKIPTSELINSSEANKKIYIASPKSHYKEITERPLFTQWRIVQKKAVIKTSPTAVDVPNLRLEGMIVVNDHFIAIIRDLKSKELLRLTDNKDYRGWKIDNIGMNFVTLQNSGATINLTLDIDLSNKPKSPSKSNPKKNFKQQKEPPSIPISSGHKREA